MIAKPPSPISHRVLSGIGLLVFVLAILIPLAALSNPAWAQICRSGDPCILTFGGASGYPAAGSCNQNYISEYKRRFLQSHFDNGTPTDFTDDPIIIAFAAGTNIFGNMADMLDPLSLPSTATLSSALSLAQSTNTPFLIHIGQWGCMNDCAGARSATVFQLMGQHDNWMLDRVGNEGFDFFWCDPAYTFTFSLHPNAGTGTNGLQALFDRNMRHLARWVKTNLIDIPANTKYLVGVVPYAETHFGDPRYTFDRNPAMLDGFRTDTRSRFGCPTNPATCLAAINTKWSTSFASLDQIVPPPVETTCNVDADYCKAWDDYRKQVLRDHLTRVATIFQQEGVPSSYLFGHDLVGASGFLPAQLDIPGRNGGLTAYGPALGIFDGYGACTLGQTTCRPWAIVEGFFSTNSANAQDATTYANDMDHVFGVGARFIHVMSQGLDNTMLLGSGWEKGIHLWGMRYSDKYQNPQASLTYAAATRTLSGSVCDSDSLWLGPLNQAGGIGTTLDLNNVALEIRIPGQATITQTAQVPNAAPTCPVGSANVSQVLPAGTTNFSVWAKDYPTDQIQRVFCYRCDDDAGPQQFVDTPAWGATISGNYRVSGWAIDYAGVTGITFRVDNQPVTLTSFRSLNRADVCAAFPAITDPNCPNVGFEGFLNTLAFSNGAHTLTATSTDAFGRTTTGSTSFNIQNAANDTTPPQQYVDFPAQNEQITGHYRVSGWAIDLSAVSTFRFEMDGQPLTLRNFRRTSRGDVCAAFPAVPDPNCPNVGWDGFLSSAAFANGTHILKVIATDTRGNAATFSRTLRIQNAVSDTAAPQQYVDVPGHAQVMSGTMTASGWSIDASGVVALTFQVDNGATLPGAVTTSRGDVCAFYASLADPNCPSVGWSISFNTRNVANGTHTLTVKATDQGGRVATFARSFVVQN